jgi:hypothetical protein
MLDTERLSQHNLHQDLSDIEEGVADRSNNQGVHKRRLTGGAADCADRGRNDIDEVDLLNENIDDPARNWLGSEAEDEDVGDGELEGDIFGEAFGFEGPGGRENRPLGLDGGKEKERVDRRNNVRGGPISQSHTAGEEGGE